MNMEWATAWAKAFNERDNAEVMKYYTDDLYFEDLFFNIQMRGRDQFMHALEAYATAPHKSTNEVVDYVGDENGGAIRWIWHFEGGGKFMGHDVTGRSCHIPGFSVVKIRDGRIYHESDIVDGIATLEELGVLKKQPTDEIDPLHGTPGWVLRMVEQS